MAEAADERRWSIGALARACGVTVRTLHHYDRIGLLTPEGRTASGHRRYTERDLRRLYRIRALRALGLSLEDIAETMAEPSEDLREVLVMQLDGVRDQIAQLTAIRDRIRELLARQPAPHQLMTTLELMSVYENYFTPEQRDRLMRRRTELGPAAVEAARTEWAAIVVRLLPHVEADTPVDDPAVADLIRRWDAIGDRMKPPGPAGERTAATARRMWQEHSAELSATLPWPAEQLTALVAYIERARQRLSAASPPERGCPWPGGGGAPTVRTSGRRR